MSEDTGQTAEALPGSEVSSDDRVLAALAWVPVSPLWPIVAVLVLLLGDTKDRTYVRHNAVLSLVTGAALIPVSILTLGIGALGYLFFFWWAYQAYQGEQVRVPVISDWIAT